MAFTLDLQKKGSGGEQHLKILTKECIITVQQANLCFLWLSLIKHITSFSPHKNPLYKVDINIISTFILFLILFPLLNKETKAPGAQ